MPFLRFPDASMRRLLSVTCGLFLMLPAAVHAGYRVEIDAPGSLEPLLASYLEIMKWRDYPEMTTEQLERLYQGIPADVQSLTATQGYFRPEVQTHWQHGESGGEDVISITVSDGPPVLVGSVDLTLAGAIEDDPYLERRRQRLYRVWTLNDGDRFTQSGWDDSKKAALLTLLARRYPTAKLVSSEALIDPASGNARLSARWDSGPAYFFGPLKVKGLYNYPPAIVERLAGFREGDVYSQRALLDFQSALQNTPYFSSVFVRLDSDPDTAAAAPVEVDLTEGPQQKVSFGLGYSTNTGERGEVSWRNVNLFQRGWILDAGVRLESKEQRAGAELTLPLDSKGYIWNGVARYERSDIQGLDTSLYRYAVSRSRNRNNIEMSTGLTYIGERARISGQPDSNTQALMLGWSWSQRAVDNPLNPRRGYTWRSELSGAARGVLSDTSFVRGYAKGVLYIPFSPRWGWSILRGEVGEVFASDGDQVPNDVLFRTGGAGSVRGYAYQSLGVEEDGAVLGGRVLGVASAEYLYPVTPKWAAAVFVDAGNAARRWQDFRFAVGYGVGARWASPVGPLGLDLAYGVDARQARLHFTLDVSF